MIVGLLFVTFIAAVANGFAVSNFLSATPDNASAWNQTLGWCSNPFARAIVGCSLT